LVGVHRTPTAAMYENANTSRWSTGCAVCICVLVHRGCRRAAHADQSNGPPCVSV